MLYVQLGYFGVRNVWSFAPGFIQGILTLSMAIARWSLTLLCVNNIINAVFKIFLFT